ncbi:MAG: efflux RND transporter periplasmic adaptor subunit [Sphingobacteriales bacterium]|nr:efflux RND transporter periplasmic adaptor subunit [Sphingobacteriales bacterium]MBI3717537.1 efflux RND transporter periplasmic adaptor subunit [Sphingobacteriales bacterium]
MKILSIGSILLSAAMFLTACGANSGAGAETKQETKTQIKESKPEKTEASENSDYVELTDEQMKAISIQLGTIEQRGINSSIKVNGVLEVPNQFKAKISSLFSGTVSTLNIRPGSIVRKGQTIATIVNPDLVNMQQQYLTVNTRINLAQLEYERQKTLVAGNAGARKNLQQAETELRTLNTEKTALQKQLSTLGISPARVASGNITSSLAIPAPISGTISKVSAQIGSFTDANTVIAEIVNNQQLQLKLLMYEKDLPKVHLNQTIQFTLTNNPAKEYQAVINSIATSFEEGTTTVAVRAAIKDTKTGLIEGMSVSAIVNMGSVTVPSVPNEAIVSFQGQDYIFVQMENETEVTEGKKAAKSTEKVNAVKEPSKEIEKTKGVEQKEKPGEPRISFKRVKVAKGAANMGYTEIKLLEEIPANAKIITRGAFFALGKMTNAGEEGE